MDEQERGRVAAQFERLKSRLPEFEAQFDEIKREVEEDGVVTPEERAEVEHVEARIRELRTRYAALHARLFEDAPAPPEPEERIVVELGDPVQPDQTTVQLDDVDVGVDMAEFFNRDSGFRGAFERSIHEWCQDSGIALNSVSTYMLSQEEPAGLSLGDVGSVVTAIFPPTAPIFTIVSFGEIVGRGYNDYLRSSGGSGPSLAEIHRAWNAGLRSLDRERGDEGYFRSFVDHYKRVNGIPPDALTTPRAAFLQACENFREDHMPSVQQVERAFTNRILRTIRDQDNPLSENYGYSGIVIASVRMDVAARAVEGEIRAGIDDCSGEMLEAVKATYHGMKIIDLPLAIRVNIFATASARNVATLWRGNRAQGGTDFRLEEGSQLAHSAFMDGRIYDQLMIHHLS